MPPTPSARGPVRSAAAVNEEIRALWQQADTRVRLTGADRARYEELYAEWTDAVRAEITTAA